MNRFLFNFAASYGGGGFKRLYEYVKWFDARGGSWFVIHRRSRHLQAEFGANRFFVVAPSRLQRLADDCGYIAEIANEIGKPDLYYSYGIPLYFSFGRVNWFHLSNVLPVARAGLSLPPYERVKFGVLGRRIRRTLLNADVISAESDYSLGLLDAASPDVLFRSVNGSDDEIAHMQRGSSDCKDNIATVLGTHHRKALPDSFRTFEMLRESNEGLRLIVIGNSKNMPRSLRIVPGTISAGVLTRSEVVEYLQRTRYYISTTLIENSYNAAAEGIFMADESYISDIGPHRELLSKSHVEEVRVPGVARRLLHVRRADLNCAHLKTWDTVIREMIARYREAVQQNRRN